MALMSLLFLPYRFQLTEEVADFEGGRLRTVRPVDDILLDDIIPQHHPSSALRKSVAPINFRYLAMTSSPSRIMTMHGPEDMKSVTLS